MEPKALANTNTDTAPFQTPAKVSFDLSSTEEFLNLSVETRRDSIAASDATMENKAPEEHEAPATPTPANVDFDDGASAWGSPTTPYYLSKGAKLVQQTCPPKQAMQPFFPVSGNIEDQPDEELRKRLLLARRKSLQWAPRVGSPLGKVGE